jgi:hypothetical protein
MIELGIMRLVRHVARMGERRDTYVHTGFCFGENLSDRDQLDVPDVDGRIILRWIFKKPD